MVWFPKIRGLALKQQPHIGVELGETGIKIAQVRKNGEAFELAHAETIPVPKGVIDNDTISDPGTVVRLLNKAVEGSGLPRRVVTAVTGTNVFIRHLLLPAMSPKEMAEAIKYEVESLIPFPLGEITYDYTKLADVNKDGMGKEEILLVAARSASVNQLAEIMQEAGLEAVAIDVEPLALIRCALMLGSTYSGNMPLADTFAMVNIGRTNTLFAVVQEKIIRFTRIIPFGSDHITGAVSGAAGPGVDTLAAGEMLTEIRRSLNFFRAQQHLDVTRLCLTGDGALLEGITRYFRENLNIETIDFNPFKMMDLGPSLQKSDMFKSGTAMAVAMGLALKEVNC